MPVLRGKGERVISNDTKVLAAHHGHRFIDTQLTDDGWTDATCACGRWSGSSVRPFGENEWHDHVAQEIAP